ncbi:MAG: hypothetical protein VXW87_01625 [Pseudomonadota bacterium]|nr:hypothetical protein [Pseudomonadota bacterium]
MQNNNAQFNIPLTFLEPTNSDYIYIDEEKNQVHVLVPLTGGHEISADNTCKLAYDLKTFFGFDHLRYYSTPDNTSAIATLENYLHALRQDINFLSGATDGTELYTIRTQKESRASQIEAHLMALRRIKRNPDYRDKIETAYPRFPTKIEQLLNQKTNLVGIKLSPPYLDSYTRSPDSSLVFSLNRDRNDRDKFSSKLAARLSQLGHCASQSVTERFIASIQQQSSLNDYQQELTRQLLRLPSDTTPDIDFKTDGDGNTIDEAWFDSYLQVGNYNDLSHDEKVFYLVNACASHFLSHHTIISPFYGSSGRYTIRNEQVNVLTQFYLASVNTYLFFKGKFMENIGTIIEGSMELKEQLAELVLTKIESNGQVEEAINQFLNSKILINRHNPNTSCPRVPAEEIDRFVSGLKDIVRDPISLDWNYSESVLISSGQSLSSQSYTGQISNCMITFQCPVSRETCYMMSSRPNNKINHILEWLRTYTQGDGQVDTHAISELYGLLSTELADTLDGRPIQNNFMLKSVCDHLIGFNSLKIDASDADSIMQQFSNNWRAIKDSEHFDEFLICDLSSQTGICFNYRAKMCISLARLALHSQIEDPHFYNLVSGEESLPRLLSFKKLDHQNTLSVNTYVANLKDLISANRFDAAAQLLLLKTNGVSIYQKYYEQVIPQVQSSCTTHQWNEVNKLILDKSFNLHGHRSHIPTPLEKKEDDALLKRMKKGHNARSGGRSNQSSSQKITFMFVFLSIITLGLYPLIKWLTSKNTPNPNQGPSSGGPVKSGSLGSKLNNRPGRPTNLPSGGQAPSSRPGAARR